MRFLVLGGTVFLSRAVATAAVARGHEVVCAARGVSGAVPSGARLVEVDRDAPDGLDPLRGQAFDAVVDVAGMSLPWVVSALSALGDAAARWTFVSTINVYADTAGPGADASAALLPPRTEPTPRSDTPSPEVYGGVKVASEDAVRAALGERALVVRGGLMTGPGDVHDRFGYWPARMAAGGPVIVPDVPAQPFQQVDVRDLAEWIVLGAETGLVGTFDGTGPAAPLPSWLAGVAEAVGGPGLELVAVAPERLVEAGVGPWAGPRSLPLWLPETHWGMVGRDVSATLAAGLRPRPLAETAADTLAFERTLDPGRERRAGLTEAEHADLLTRFG